MTHLFVAVTFPRRGAPRSSSRNKAHCSQDLNSRFAADRRQLGLVSKCDLEKVGGWGWGNPHIAFYTTEFRGYRGYWMCWVRICRLEHDPSTCSAHTSSVYMHKAGFKITSISQRSATLVYCILGLFDMPRSAMTLTIVSEVVFRSHQVPHMYLHVQSWKKVLANKF